jgi:dihydrofolate reductase
LIISLIVAVDEKGGIGKKNQLPWHLRSDFQRFKSITMGHHLVMGRKTYETIGIPLPGRTMIIITKNQSYLPKGCIVVNSIEEAIRVADRNNEKEVFIIGGGEVYKQSIDIANKIYLTAVHADTDADVFFPKIDNSSWKMIWSEEIAQDKKDEYQSDYKIFVRKSL